MSWLEYNHSRRMSKVGDVYRTNSCGDIEVLEMIPHGNSEIMIKFLDTGFVKRVNSGAARKGEVTDPTKKTVSGVGYLGDGQYKSCSGKDNPSKSYMVWRRMIERCYDKRDKRYDLYKRISVDSKWHNYQNFAEWYNDNVVEGYHLDKDLLGVSKGVYMYSEDTCCFLPNMLNNLIKMPCKYRLYPYGVTRKVTKKGFVRYVATYGTIHLGTFDTMHDAFLHYKEYKESLIKEEATKCLEDGKINEKVMQALCNWSVAPYSIQVS